MRRALAVVALAASAAQAACSAAVDSDVGLQGLALSQVAPDTIVPGTALALEGDSFVDAAWGDSTLRLVGTADGVEVDLRWPAQFVDFDHMVVPVDVTQLDEAGGDVDLVGEATVEVVSAVDGRTYTSAPLPVSLRLRTALTPTVTAIQTDTLTFVNDPIEVEGDGFLLGGAEGDTVAIVEGCFEVEFSGDCVDIDRVTVPLLPRTPFDRGAATFPLLPEITGIQPGTFTGTVTIRNRPPAGGGASASAEPVSYDLTPPEIFEFTPTGASLGQYVFIDGGGFVGGDDGFVEIQLDGTFRRNGGDEVPASLSLIPEFVSGRLARYVVNEDDALAGALDLRADTGVFRGTATPLVAWNGDEIEGPGTDVVLRIQPVKQVVYLEYLPSYVEAMRFFGLRAVDQKIRDRIAVVVERAYQGVNLELRAEPPTDFALYEWVQLLGEDPNGMGLFGYDNSPGKDNDNLRLYDRLGGVNAQTQQDGYPGYGGVFVASLMGFSLHPLGDIEPIPGADPAFDEVMDPFRDDRGGHPIDASDLDDGIDVLTDGASCPAEDRAGQVACAIYVMGNLIGGTLAHEIGHSLGLANPGQEGFHNTGDAPGRLMDSGGDRPFLERAELGGVEGAKFCDSEFDYLRVILPTDEAPPPGPRPSCF
jgi:hypothetical protein